jgi:hypothetical protein
MYIFPSDVDLMISKSYPESAPSQMWKKHTGKFSYGRLLKDALTIEKNACWGQDILAAKV